MAIALRAPYCAMLLSHYDQNSACALRLQKQSSSSRSPGASLSLSASLTGRIWLNEKAGTHECFVVKRHKVRGELVEYEEQKAMLASLPAVMSKNWMAAIHFKPSGSHVSIKFDMSLMQPGTESSRSTELWLYVEYCAEQYYAANHEEVAAADRTAVSELLCGRLKEAAYLVEQKRNVAFKCKSFRLGVDRNGKINGNMLPAKMQVSTQLSVFLMLRLNMTGVVKCSTLFLRQPGKAT